MKKQSWHTPTPTEIKQARESAGLSLKDAGDLVCTSVNGWQKWEAELGTSSHRTMHPAFWKLFNIELKKIRRRATKE